MRRVLPLLLAIVALLTVAVTPALGQQEPHRFSGRQNGVQADAFWETCTPDTPVPGQTTCEIVSIFAFDGRSVFRENGSPPMGSGGSVCLTLDVFNQTTGEPVSIESGCTDTFAFQAASDLSSATASATVPVETFVCTPDGNGGFICEPSGDPPRDVAVSVSWTAAGPLTKFRDRFVSRTEAEGLICVFKQSGRGVRTDAVATATVDGAALGESVFATVTRGRFEFVDKCFLA
jgi:hypothetical protein